MMLIVAAALATASMPNMATSRTSASVQSTATIRVVQGVQLKLDAAVNPGAPPARDAVLRLSDGTTQPARLIEFQ
jgi:hypothetical protein